MPVWPSMLPLFPKFRSSIQAPDSEEFVTWLKTSSGSKWLAQLYSQVQCRHAEMIGPILNVRQPPAVGELAKQLFMMDTDRAKWVVVRLRAAAAQIVANVSQLAAWPQCTYVCLQDQLLGLEEQGRFNLLLDAYLRAKAQHYLQEYGLRTATVVAGACMLLHVLKRSMREAMQKCRHKRLRQLVVGTLDVALPTALFAPLIAAIVLLK